MTLNTSATAARLHSIILTEGGEAVAAFLESLSHSQRRAACAELADKVLPLVPVSDFWNVALTLVRRNAKAYLGLVLKAAPVDIDPAFARHIVTEGSEVDLQKVIAALLSRQQSPEGVERLFRLLELMSPRRRARYLVQWLTLPAAFILFQDMRRMEAERPLLLSICHRLIADDTPVGWGLASLARTYFDLPELRGTFSLILQPYELARLETSYEAFCKRVGA